MSFRSSQDARCYVGILAASAYARSVSLSSPLDMHDITTLENRAKVFIPGQDTSTFSIAGPLDTDATSNGQYDAVTDLKASTAATPITYAPLGTDGAVWLVGAWETSIDTMGGVAGTIDWAMTAQGTGQPDFNGRILSALTAITVDTNGASTDNGAATANGGVAHLHVTAFSGLTSDAIIVEHSTNDSTWATLGTFTTVTGVTSQRLEIAAGTTVNRYLRVVDDVTGTGSCTRLVAFSRR
jgi:hypothetical protein